MTDLEIKKVDFGISETDLSLLALEYKGLEASEDLQKIKSANTRLQKRRTQIEKVGKKLRDKHNKFAKTVLRRQEFLIEIIQPTEKKLNAKKIELNNKITIKKRIRLLSPRIEKLKKINVELDNDSILLMDNKQFDIFYNEKYTEFLDEKERVVQKSLDKIATKEVLEKAEMKTREDERQKIESELKSEKEEKARKAQKFIKEKRVKNFLDDLGFEDNENFMIKKTDTKIILYKKIGELEI